MGPRAWTLVTFVMPRNSLWCHHEVDILVLSEIVELLLNGCHGIRCKYHGCKKVAYRLQGFGEFFFLVYYKIPAKLMPLLSASAVSSALANISIYMVNMVKKNKKLLSICLLALSL